MNHSQPHLEHRRRPAIGSAVRVTILSPAVVGHDTVAHTTAARAIEVHANTRSEEGSS